MPELRYVNPFVDLCMQGPSCASRYNSQQLQRVGHDVPDSKVTFAHRELTAGSHKNQSTQWVTVPLHLTPRLTKFQDYACSTEIVLHPGGHDTWRFNYSVQMHYSDGTTDACLIDNHARSEKTFYNKYPLSR